MSEIVFKSTAEALEHVHTLKRCAEGFQNFGSEMLNAKATIQANWDADVTSSDIAYITGMLGDLNREANDISECLNKLALGVDSFAKAIESVGNGSGGSFDPNRGTCFYPAPGFWDTQVQNFSDNWDYSKCDDAWDYVTTTGEGVVDTIVDAGNFVVEGISEIVDWIF